MPITLPSLSGKLRKPDQSRFSWLGHWNPCTLENLNASVSDLISFLFNLHNALDLAWNLTYLLLCRPSHLRPHPWHTRHSQNRLQFALQWCCVSLWDPRNKLQPAILCIVYTISRELVGIHSANCSNQQELYLSSQIGSTWHAYCDIRFIIARKLSMSDRIA